MRESEEKRNTDHRSRERERKGEREKRKGEKEREKEKKKMPGGKRAETGTDHRTE